MTKAQVLTTLTEDDVKKIILYGCKTNNHFFVLDKIKGLSKVYNSSLK